MDEHQEQVEGQLSQRTDGVARVRREMVQEGLLEPVRLRVRPEGGVHVAGVAQRRPDLVRFGVFAFDRVGGVRLHGLPELAADDAAADDVRDRPNGPEPLLPEEVREAAERPELPRGFCYRRRGFLRREGEAPHDDLETVASEIPDLQAAIRSEHVHDLDVGESQRLDRLRPDVVEGEQLRRDGALVFRPREADSPAADVERPRELPDESVRLPVPQAKRRDRIAAVGYGRRRGRDFLDREVVRRLLEDPADPGRGRQVAFDPDVALHGPMRAPSPRVSSRRRTPRRGSPRPA